jgi:hypothetical protein
MPNINHNYKCKCGKPATFNIQNWWRSYVINKDGSFDEAGDWEGDTNVFLCDDCEKKFNIYDNPK